MQSLVTGTSKSHQRAQVESVLKIAVVLPPPSIARAFERAVASDFERVLAIRNESETLSALRNTLLPELISGDLRLDPAKDQSERRAT